MPDSHLGPRWRHMARILRGEQQLTAAARRALSKLLAYTGQALNGADLDLATLSPGASGWRSAVEADILPVVQQQFLLAFNATALGVVDPAPYATRHLEAVWSRLQGVPDEVFDTMRHELELGRAAGESIPQLATRVDALLGDSERWTGRAVTIARTEVIGANNAGGYSAARSTSQVLQVDESQVVKEWLATSDGRTRETHAEADGQQVLGLEAPFQVGGDSLAYAGDPSGSAAEVINCRCTVLYHYPGDPGYPTGGGALAAAATPQEDQMAEDDETPTGVIVVALPAADSPVHGIGAEDKHATLCFLGDAADLPDGTDALIRDAIETWLSIGGSPDHPAEPFDADVTAVESLGDDGARVWMLEGDQITDLHDAMMGLQPIGDLDREHNEHPEFTPHVTIGYPAADPEDVPEGDRALLDPETEVAAADVAAITFDRLALWWAGEQTEWPLATGDQEPEEAPVETETDAVTAAAGDPAPTPPAQTLDAGDPAPEVAPDGGIGLPGPEDDDQFYGVAVVEDSQTGDGRVFAPGSIKWDTTPLPMPLGWQVADAMGHDGSVVCGRIDTIVRFGNLIGYTGTWDVDGAGYETRRLVEGQFLTGLSVDTDDFDAIVVDQDGNPLDPMAMMFEGDPIDPILLVQSSRLRSAAMCRVPAFVEAFVANGTPPPGWAGERPGAAAAGEAPVEEPTEEEVVTELVAAANRRGNPPAQLPSLGDYSNPQLTVPTPITITPEGRVYGHIAVWGTCHIGFDGTCVTPPHSLTGYAHFLKGEVETDGGVVPVGRLTMDTGHADTSLSASAAAAHYDNTGTGVANITCGEDEVGIWFSGRLTARATPVQVAELRAAGAVSGDWRRQGGNLEMVACLGVNVAGFPIPRLALAASGERQLSLVASGVVTPETRALPFTADEVARHAVAIIDRRTRAHAAQARLRTQRASAASHRLAVRVAQDRKDRVAAAAARLGRE